MATQMIQLDYQGRQPCPSDAGNALEDKKRNITVSIQHS